MTNSSSSSNYRESGTNTPAYRNAYATGMLIELTWLTSHFDGLLNVWFTVLHTFDEASLSDDEIDGESPHPVGPRGALLRHRMLVGTVVL